MSGIDVTYDMYTYVHKFVLSVDIAFPQCPNCHKHVVKCVIVSLFSSNVLQIAKRKIYKYYGSH